MLTALIRKDDSSEVPRQVADMAAARALLSDGMPVFILHGDGTRELVTAEDASPVEPPPAEPEVGLPAEPQAPSDEPVDEHPV